MHYELKSIRIWSFTKVSFFVNLVVGFGIGLIYAAMFPIMVAAVGRFGGFYGSGFDPADMPFGVMLLVMPIMGAMFAAVFHTIVGIVLVAIYNLIARMVGGLEFHFDPKVSPEASTRPQPRPIYATAAASVSPPPPPPPASGRPVETSSEEKDERWSPPDNDLDRNQP